MKFNYDRFSFSLEFIFNGLFIILYSFMRNDSNSLVIGGDIVNQLVTFFTYAAPVIIASVVISNFKKSANLEDFVRKYVFSIIVLAPLVITYGDREFAFWLSAVHLFSSILSLYETGEKDKADRQKKRRSRKFSINLVDKIKLAPAQIVIITFLGIILIGTLLLALPISSSDGKSLGFLDSFFIATSATCVTGLSTLSLSDNFSFIGQVVVLLLIQIGGLGYMTLYSSLTILLGRSLALKEQVVMQDLLDISSLEDLLSMIIDIIKFTFVIEIIGAIILSLGFSYEGYDFGQSVYLGIFHSISAFCNAGFSLFNDSMESFGKNSVISNTIALLIILGGLGFIVLKELEVLFFKKKKIVNLSVHSKVVLTTNAILILGVGLYFFFSEYLHSIEQYRFIDQVQYSFFHAVTTRTAGFNTISLNALQPHTLYLTCLVMFIGASPGSTGGGIKTTTFAILFQSVKATLNGSDRVQFFDRKIPNSMVVRSVAIIIISLFIVSAFILLMMQLEANQSFLAVFFEVVSAFATVGLSLGITPFLSPLGKFAIIVLMIIGRVGPLTLALAIGQKRRTKGKVDYPDGRIMIG